MITEVIRGTKRQLRATQKGTAIVSLQTRQNAFPDIPADPKQTLKALVKSTAPPPSTTSTTSKSTTPSTASKSSSSTSTKKDKTNINSLVSPIPNVLKRMTQATTTPTSTKKR